MSAAPLSIARMLEDRAARAAGAACWEVLREQVRRRAADVWAPLPPSATPCASCQGPTRPGYPRCFHCELHAQSAPGMLADVITPVAYAPKGGQLASDLWIYKSGRPEAPGAAAFLRALLLLFLHDHGQDVWRRAGMTAPTAACVVPSRRGRPTPHPLQALASGCLALPWTPLRTGPGSDPWARTLDPNRFRAPGPLTGAMVLLLDDTWTSGGSAQSAAVALKRAGARSVAVVVLGRHLPGSLAPGPPAGPGK